MAFPHHIVIRVSWFVSACVAVILLARELRRDDDASVSQVTSVNLVPEILPDRAMELDVGPVELENVIVALTMVGDDESVADGFTLTRPMEVRVTAVGEGTGGQMHDYGAILDAATQRPVWTMDLRATHHAGGADKNRMIDEMVSLEAGSYLVHYVTDGTHSYGDWNSEEPWYPELWGITVSSHGPIDREVVRPYDDRANDAVLARIVRVRDDAYHEERFTLDRAAEVRVYAIGEGDASDMYDYAQLEDARTGRVVWRMTYRETQHAGGAAKNRVFDGVMRLQAGEYNLVYQSDDSHSFGEWNSAAPEDRFNYGVTILKR